VVQIGCRYTEHDGQLNQSLRFLGTDDDKISKSGSTEEKVQQAAIGHKFQSASLSSK
jgi:hypothetical protein